MGSIFQFCRDRLMSRYMLHLVALRDTDLSPCPALFCYLLATEIVSEDAYIIVLWCIKGLPIEDLHKELTCLLDCNDELTLL